MKRTTKALILSLRALSLRQSGGMRGGVLRRIQANNVRGMRRRGRPNIKWFCDQHIQYAIAQGLVK